LNIKERAEAFRSQERRRKEIVRFKNKLKKLSKANIVTGGREYIYYTGDNFKDETFPIGFSLDAHETNAVATMYVGYDKVMRYLDDTDATADMELRLMVADSLLSCNGALSAESARLLYRVDNLMRITEGIRETVYSLGVAPKPKGMS
jgi:hypothetical protein